MSTTATLPKTFQKIICTKLTTNFVEATKVVTVDTPTNLKPNEVLVRNRFIGINASDINFTAGRYASGAPPFDCGFEALGEVVAKGDKSPLKMGQAVGYNAHGAFSEYKAVETAMPLPAVKAEYLPLFVSGLTAAISIDKIGEVKAGDVVLVTAAAGGTGQFAVQWAKHKGAKTVIGTCSSDDKVAFLKSLGCDRAINYRKEVLKDVLLKEFPNGVDVVYESVGGDTFDICVNALADHGRLIIIGAIGSYEKGDFAQPTSTLPVTLLRKSASVRGFFLPHFAADIPAYLRQLVGLYDSGKLKSICDFGESSGRRFTGIGDIHRAIEHMYGQKNIGKVVVEIGAGQSSL